MTSSEPVSAINAIPMLRSKLSAPVQRTQLVGRERIVDRVLLAVGAKLIMVRGPAGFGKTTVLLELKERFERDGAVTAWLTLDEADNDVLRFLAYLEYALGQALKPGDRAVVEATKESHDLAEQATNLIDRFATNKVPLVLFLDEFEALKEPAALAMVGQMIERLPPGAQIVIGTRTVPEIGLGRLRARGQLAEVSPSELRMTEEETSLFLTQRRGLTLNSRQVSQLHKGTEGWIAALWLASMSLERRDDPDAFIGGFSGSNAAIADYLAEDVLARQPESIREFLLQSSVLEILSAPLCAAVLQREDSAEVLRAIDRANLFLVPIDSERREYRYHSLFAGFLREQLERRHLELPPQLHRRAAEWYIQQNRPIPAIRHAVSTADWEFAGQVISRYAERLMEQGRLRPLSHALDSLPVEVFEEAPQLRLIQAWATLFTHGAIRASALIAAVEAQANTTEEFNAHRMALESIRLGMLDRVEDAYQVALERLPNLSASYAFPYCMAAQTMALTCMILGKHTEARQYADAARNVGSERDLGFSAQISNYVDSAIDLIQGRLKRAASRLKSAAVGGGENYLSSFNRNAMPGLLLAETLYETNALPAAQRLLEAYVPLVNDLGLADQLIVAHTLLARVVSDGGDQDRALMLLSDLESIGRRLQLPRVVGSARLECALLALRSGDLNQAKADLDRAGDEEVWRRIERYAFIANDTVNLTIARLRWQVRSGATEKVVERLRMATEDAEREGRHRRALKLRILLAEAMHRSGQHKIAMRTMTRALEAASAEGFVRAFLDEGSYVESMIQEALAALSGVESQAAGQLAVLEFGKHLSKSKATISPGAVSNAALADPLTSKEIRVLEFLAEGLGNNAIGDRMFISESTVRAHLRAINTKLQTSNRVQALVVARRMGFIS